MWAGEDGVWQHLPDLTVVATNRDLAQSHLHEFYPMQRLFRIE